MLELAIDSASDDAAVALVDGERVLAERRWRVATTYSRELLAGIEATLAAAGAARDAMGAIAVNAGPGGYSSLRTGVATAQGLALALDIPLAGVDRLETHAYPHLAEAYAVGIGAVVAVHQLGRAGLAWAAYAAAPHGAPQPLAGPRIDTPEACAAAVPAAALWCGDLDGAPADALRAARAALGRTADGPADRFVPPERNVRAPADLVRLARLHHAYGDPAAVDVVYLRPPAIGARAPAATAPPR